MTESLLHDFEEADQSAELVLRLIDALNRASMKAQIDKGDAVLQMTAHQASQWADAIFHLLISSAPYRITDAAAIAEQTMKDEALRFTCAVTDLELLLENFIGRPPMTMAEVREASQKRDYAMRDRHPRTGMQVSSELAKSIRSGRIGDPREPGQEG